MDVISENLPNSYFVILIYLEHIYVLKLRCGVLDLGVGYSDWLQTGMIYIKSLNPLSGEKCRLHFLFN